MSDEIGTYKFIPGIISDSTIGPVFGSTVTGAFEFVNAVKMTDSDILNPKLMAPTCAALWEWYKTVAPRLKSSLINRDGIAVEDIVEEIEAHAVEIEYLCKT